jgi:hypothetical protein
MRNASCWMLVGAIGMVGLVGCGPSDGERLDTLTTKTDQDAKDIASTKASTSGLVDQAKAYCDGKVSGAATAMNESVQSEAQRAQAAEAAEAKARMDGDAATLAASKSYSDLHAVAATETHLFATGAGAMGKDLDVGRLHGVAFTAAVVSGRKVDIYRDGTFWIYFDGACSNNKPTGNAFMSNPPRMLGSDRYVGDGGKLYKVTSSTPTPRVSVASRVSALKACENIGGAFDMVPAATSGDTGAAYDPLQLYTDDVVVTP